MKTPALRAATPDDAALAADVMTASFPREPQDPVLTARRWQHPRQGWSYARFIAELDGTPVAFVEWQHGPWEKLPERDCWLEVWLDVAHLDKDLLAYLWRWAEEAASAGGARRLIGACGEDERLMAEVLEDLGYAWDRTERVWALDLDRHGPAILAAAASARERMGSTGIQLTTLEEWHDPNRFEKLHRLHERTRQDVPHTGPILPESLRDFMTRIESPDTPSDRRWIALQDGEPVAMSYLSYPPVRGVVWTQYTATQPEQRGRGIARAVKLQTLAQAVDLGVPEVHTANDSENPAMLHINETLGYELQPGFLSFVKRLAKPALR